MKKDIGVLKEYPRPSFIRKEWINLNGTWDFQFDDSNIGEIDKWYKEHPFQTEINVPYCYQSELSGINDKTFHPVVWYNREVKLDDNFLDQRVVLNFGAVDFDTKLWVNGDFVGGHQGGNVAFNFDLTLHLKSGNNKITLRVEDQEDPAQPRGKQSWKGKPFECWYTPTTGIWQSVWLEKVGTTFIESVLITPDVDNKTAKMEFALENMKKGLNLKLELYFKGNFFKSMDISLSNRHPVITVDIDNPDELDASYLWHPEHPNLFDLKLSIIERNQVIDQVDTYFGMRKISSRDGVILINNMPYFQKLILDQGYWDESLMTPPTDLALKEDIEKSMSMGFNGARKHQKMEDPSFYYWADKLGFLVWGEMPSNYNFSNRGIDLITNEWKSFVNKTYNHPSIITWVPVNESWGVWNIVSDKQKQDFSNALYYLTKSLDKTRLVSGNDGWEQTESDICGIHDYVAKGEDFLKKTVDKESYLKTFSDWRMIYADGYKYSGQPIMLTEYGGIAFASDDIGWGYQGKVKDEDEFIARFKSITESIIKTGYFTGLCYTQLTDVQQEMNGLMHADRSFKVSPKRIKEILDNL